MDKCTNNNECEASLIMTVTRDLSRRADRCCALANEVTKPECTLEIIGKVEKEIITFMLMLEPFKLTEEDVKKDEKLKVSHYAEISTLHAMASDARKKVLRQRASVEERKVAIETAGRVERPTSSYGRNKERPATEEGDKKLPARPVTREGRD
jgi:hypothetical protein